MEWKNNRRTQTMGRMKRPEKGEYTEGVEFLIGRHTCVFVSSLLEAQVQQRWPKQLRVSSRNKRRDIVTHFIEHILQIPLCERRTLDILDGSQLPRKPLALIGSDRSLLLSL